MYLTYLKKKVLTKAQRQKLIKILSSLSDLDASRREFKQIKDIFVPPVVENEDEDEDEDEDDEDEDE